MAAKKFYLTSAIPYVNAAPHIGHAQEFVYADVIRRYHQLLGEDVRYLCGADENALKIVQAAEAAKQDPQTFTDAHNNEFLALAEKLDVHFDIWQRGTDKNHHFPSSQKLWELCNKNGDIYKKSYEGLYCVGCETFYAPDELDKNGECFEHPGKKLEKISEENYFFKLSKYQDFIQDILESNTLKILPDFRKNEALGFVKKGLEDFSISRSRQRAKGWGVPVPNDPNQIMYVWFDALNIYQTGIGFGWDDKEYRKWSPQDVMVIGKGITRFHAIYWPAILKSAGLPLPKQLFVHGYLTVNGQKMSKTVGNVIDPMKVIEKYGTDATRYYLLREIPSYSDGDFSFRRFKEVYNADLANGLGNLVARIAKLCESTKLYVGKSDTGKFHEFIKQTMETYQFHLSLESIWERIASRNKQIDIQKPWENPEKKHHILVDLIEGLREIAYDLKPFLPDTAKKIVQQFKGPSVKSQPSLFPRLS